MLRIGPIGCGRIGKLDAAAIAADPATAPTVVHDAGAAAGRGRPSFAGEKAFVSADDV